VAVDVALEDTVAGMRPDLSVDAHDRVSSDSSTCSSRGGPRTASGNSTIGMFKITDDGHYANRVQVQVGRSSVNTIEVNAWPERARFRDPVGHVAVGQRGEGENQEIGEAMSATVRR